MHSCVRSFDQRTRAVASSAWLLVAGLLIGCGGHHVKLVTPAASAASTYTCKAGQDCQPAEVDDPAALNQSGTTFVKLPRQCDGRFQQIVVLNADSDTPEVHVTCATRESRGPIEPMGDNGTIESTQDPAAGDSDPGATPDTPATDPADVEEGPIPEM